MTLLTRFLQLVVIIAGGAALLVGGVCSVGMIGDPGLWQPKNRAILVFAFCATAFLFAVAGLLLHAGFGTFRRIATSEPADTRPERLRRAFAQAVVAVFGLGSLMIGGMCTIGPAVDGGLTDLLQFGAIGLAGFAAAFGCFLLWRKIGAGA